MAFQPKLNKSTPHIGKINYTLKRTESSCAKAKGPIDDAHIHTCYEIYVNVSGNVSFLHGNKIFEIKPYDVIFSRPGELHHCIYRPELPHDHYCLWFNDDGNYFENESLCNFSGHLRLNESEKKRLARLLEKLDEETNTETEEIICLLSVFSLISGKENTKETEITRSESRINEILEYIDAHLSEIRRISEVADAFYLSVSSLNRILREETSLSPKKLLEAKRLTAAERLLRQGVGVTEACFAVGFSDCSRFISKFKDKFGVTPNKYKTCARQAKN